MVPKRTTLGNAGHPPPGLASPAVPPQIMIPPLPLAWSPPASLGVLLLPEQAPVFRPPIVNALGYPRHHLRDLRLSLRLHSQKQLLSNDLVDGIPGSEH